MSFLGTRQLAENVLNWIPNAASGSRDSFRLLGLRLGAWCGRSVKYAALRANL